MSLERFGTARPPHCHPGRHLMSVTDETRVPEVVEFFVRMYIVYVIHDEMNVIHDKRHAWFLSERGTLSWERCMAASSRISFSDFTFTLRTQSSRALFSKKTSLPAGL